MLVLAVLLGVATVSAENYWPHVCTNATTGYQQTRCDEGATCCSQPFSDSGVGCCPWPNAVCCANNYTCCPEGYTCKDQGEGSRAITTCVKEGSAAVAGKQVCKPGPYIPLSTTLKNVFILGDSVSIGYTPFVHDELLDIALVQHSPWAGDGGAEETAYGLQCLDYYLSSPSGVALKPDVLVWNFGLHDGPLGNTTLPGQQGNSSVYPAQLRSLAHRIRETLPTTTILFALTTPVVCSLNSTYNVEWLNAQARSIVQAEGMGILDLFSPIMHQCGPLPNPTCMGSQGCWCPHCPHGGYEWLSKNTIAPALRAILQ